MSKNLTKEEIAKKKEETQCEPGKRSRCRTYKSARYAKSGLQGQTVCSCALVRFVQKNEMRVRINDPSDALWYKMRKAGDLYYIVADNYGGAATRLFTLAYGEPGVGKIKTIGFARGVPKTYPHKAGDQINTSELRSQAALISWDVLGIPRSMIDEYERDFRRWIVAKDTNNIPEIEASATDMLNVQNAIIPKFMQSKYLGNVKKQIENEWGVTVTSMNVVPKNEGFQLEFNCTGTCKLMPPA